MIKLTLLFAIFIISVECTKELVETESTVKNSFLSNRKPKEIGHLDSLLERGVYLPDERFNDFIDGVLVNFITDLKRKKIDPLYFRITDQGVIEPVIAHRFKQFQTSKLRRSRRSSLPLGGGVLNGISKIRRIGDSQTQKVANLTLIKAVFLAGPVNIIIDYRGNPRLTRVTTRLPAIQFDTLTGVDRFGSEKADFRWNTPLFNYMPYYGNRTLPQQKLAELVVRKMLSRSSLVPSLIEESFSIASYDKIIPHFGAEANYFAVIQNLFKGVAEGRESPKMRESVHLEGRNTPEQETESNSSLNKVKNQDLESKSSSEISSRKESKTRNSPEKIPKDA